jgi:hypothetical protein
MTVFCFEVDAEEVRASLEGVDGWFEGHNVPLANITVEITQPTPTEEESAREQLDDTDDLLGEDP